MSSVLEMDALARHHAEKAGKKPTAEEAGHGVDARLRPFPSVTLWPSPTIARTLPTHSILCVDTDFSDAREERITITHHLGAIIIVGTGLAPLAARLRKLHIGDVRAGKQEEGGEVERITLDVGEK